MAGFIKTLLFAWKLRKLSKAEKKIANNTQKRTAYLEKGSALTAKHEELRDAVRKFKQDNNL